MTVAEPPQISPLAVVADDVVAAPGVIVRQFANLYGCRLGEQSQVGPYVEIQRGVEVGRLVKVSSHSFICEGVTIEDEVFIGHGVRFINDRVPRSAVDGRLMGPDDWTMERTLVRRGASVGSGAVILGGLTIGEQAVVGAGAVVTKNVAPRTVVAGNPARLLRTLDDEDTSGGETGP